jgi:hypothetical protein
VPAPCEHPGFADLPPHRSSTSSRKLEIGSADTLAAFDCARRRYLPYLGHLDPRASSYLVAVAFLFFPGKTLACYTNRKTQNPEPPPRLKAPLREFQHDGER